MWVLVTLVASCFQILRTSEQHRLRSRLDVYEATYARFVFAAPLAALVLAVQGVVGDGVPSPPPRFWAIALGAGVAQILATVALLASFRSRDFAIGTVYAKTEVVTVGVFSAVLLDEALPPAAWFGVVAVLAGVVVLAVRGDAARLHGALVDPAAGLGWIAGAGFALAAVGIRGAADTLDGSDVVRALTTHTAILVVQTVVQGGALAASTTSSAVRVLTEWRRAMPVALLSLGGSAGWALALSLQNAARVRTLGQVEIVLAFLIGVVVHHERHRRAEYVAAAVVVAGAFLVVTA